MFLQQTYTKYVLTGKINTVKHSLKKEKHNAMQDKKSVSVRVTGQRKDQMALTSCLLCLQHSSPIHKNSLDFAAPALLSLKRK